jgi:hypothetical protein
MKLNESTGTRRERERDRSGSIKSNDNYFQNRMK